MWSWDAITLFGWQQGKDVNTQTDKGGNDISLHCVGAGAVEERKTTEKNRKKQKKGLTVSVKKKRTSNGTCYFWCVEPGLEPCNS